MNNFSWLWDIGALFSCLVPGHGMIRIEEYGLLEYKHQMVVQSIGSGLVGLHMTDMLKGKSFAKSRNWLGLGGALSWIRKDPDNRTSGKQKMRKYS